MRIFLTGATGYVGAAILDSLLRGGHTVTALVRDSEKAARVAARGARPVIGHLGDVESFRGAVEAQDGYVHAARDSMRGRGPSIERLAIDTILAAARRPRTGGPENDKRFVIFTSGLWILGRALQPVAEDAPLNPLALASHRPEHERLVLEASVDGLRTMVVRPGVVYGDGKGMVGDIFKAATNGLVRVIGDGGNRWPLVYVRDLADLYAKLAVNSQASGIFHANDEGDERVNDIVSAISPYLPVRPDVRHVPIEEARAKMGPLADALALDQIIRSPRARAIGWTPTLHSVGGNAARLLEEWRRSRTLAADS
jgi:nucleoside-diphosphate-sugar epimerase